MAKLSGSSAGGLRVRINVEIQQEYRDFYRGRAQVTAETGDAYISLFPTAAEMRALAAELMAAADSVEA